MRGIIFFQVIFHCVIAQDNDIRFNLVEGTNGKPLGRITAITQDPHGYMWFAGSKEKCLYRYDGNRMISFRQDSLNPNSLGGTDLKTVYADDVGMIWIGFGDVFGIKAHSGLDQFNPATGIFKHFRHEKDDPGSLSSNGVNVILKDRQGRFWVGTGNGLDRLDGKTGKFFHYRNEPGNPASLSSNVVREIYEDRQGVIWIGTGRYPWLKMDLEDGGLNRLKPDGTFTRYLHDPQNSRSLINNKVGSIFEDSRGVFWIGTAGDGLHTMDRDHGSFERHPYDPTRPDQLSRPAQRAGDENRITFIREDGEGAIWIGTNGSGINRYDTRLKKITHYESIHGFPDRVDWDASTSSDGVLWLSTEDNLFRIDPFRRTMDDIGTGEPAISFLEDKEGFFWVGTDGNGLLQYDQQQRLIHRFNYDASNPSGLFDNIIPSLFQNLGDTIWLGTTKGIGIFDKITKHFSIFPPRKIGSNDTVTNPVNTILQDKQGSIWFARLFGLLRYNPQDGSIKEYHPNPKDSGTIASDRIYCVLEDRSGELWAGAMEQGGISRLNRQSGKVGIYLKGLGITSIVEDMDGIIWAGTDKGLYRFNKGADHFSAFFDPQSEFGNVWINGMIEDNAKNLWISTPSAIVRVDPGRNATFTFGSKFGIPANSLAYRGIYKTRSGRIFVGHKKGFYAFSPALLDNKIQPLKIIITGISIDNFPLLQGKESPLPEPVEEISELVLKHNQNNFTLNYATLDYRAPEANRYFTMLEGYDNTWREAVGDKSSYYFSVPPGKYTFRLKAYNSDGVRGEKVLAIRIDPPWWKTSWAYAGCLLLAAGILAGARRTIIQRERLKSNLKLEQIEREKEHIRFEKAKEVDKMKTSFFTNISHEFRTPLTLIKGPAQNLLEEFSNKPKVREQLELIQHNSDLLLKLINQLLDLAKLETGNLQVVNTEGDLSAFLEVLVHSFSSAALQKEIKFHVRFPEIRYQVSFDKDKLETILFNLIGNAIKFTPPFGKLTFEGIVENSPPIGGKLIIIVSDTGIGIPLEHQAKIFERFYQVNEGGAHTEVGTGIGLSLVKELTELLGGKITVNSEPGIGSEFHVVLPLNIIGILNGADNLTKPEGAAALPQEGTTADENDGVTEKPKVLVVEDNTGLRKFIIASLGSEYEFLEAADGKQGLEIASGEIPELVISDVMMPVMDGITMTGKIKNDIRTSHIPVILLTAKSTEESKLSGLDIGADDYLIKPFNKSELVIKVRNAIASRIKIREKVRLELLSEAPKIEATSEEEQFLVKVKETILSRLADEQLSVESLARDLGWSRAQFYRKVTALTGQPVNELIRSFRLQKAVQLLDQHWGPVSQVAYEVGFSNPSYFSKCFKDQFGVSPSEYASRIN